MVKFVSRQISSFRGLREARVGLAKKQGRRLPNVESSLRSLRRPRGLGVSGKVRCWVGLGVWRGFRSGD